MTAIEMKEKRTRLLNEATKLNQNKTITKDQLARIDDILADIELIDLRMQRNSASTPPPRPHPGAAIDSEQATAEKRAFGEYIRYGRVSPDLQESRDLGSVTGGAITGGSQLIPQAFYPVLTDAQKSWGALTTIVNTKKTDTGAPMKIAFANDTANQLSVVGEAVAVSEADPAFSGIISNTDFTTTGVVKVSLVELQDSAFDIDSWLRSSFGKRYWRGVSQMITSGSSTGNVQSIVSSATTVASPNHLAISYQDLVNLYGALDPAYIETATWVMNSSTRASMMSVVDGFGRPLFIPSPNAGAFDTLLGRPVVLNQYQDNIGLNTKPLMFGDFQQGYTFRTVGDLSIVRLIERYADTGEIGVIGFARIGGFATDAGTHPIHALQMAAS